MRLLKEFPFPKIDDSPSRIPIEVHDALSYLATIHMHYGMRYGKPAMEFLETLAQKYPENEDIVYYFRTMLKRTLMTYTYFFGPEEDQIQSDDQLLTAEKLYHLCNTIWTTGGKCLLDNTYRADLEKISPALTEKFEKIGVFPNE